jgi:hypothetical protein
MPNGSEDCAYPTTIAMASVVVTAPVAAAAVPVALSRRDFALIPTFLVTLSNACRLASLGYALTARSLAS